MKIQKNVLLKEYTTFKIGGPAKYFCAVENKEDLIRAVSFAKKEKIPLFILGGGSNLLVSDEGFKGLVIKIENCKLKIVNSRVIAGAGVSLAKLVSITSNAGLSGMEWASGIPGATVGGAIRGNAGAFGAEMKDITKTVIVLEIQNPKSKIQNNNFKIKIRNFNNKDCRFSYRSSIFKENPDLIIFSCELEMKRGDKVKEKVKEILSYRKEKHPAEPSAGSIFKNLENIRARDLIEKAGLKGRTIGGAQISEHHANFIVNLGGAKSKDVLDLIDLAKKEVKNKFGIEIEEEIKYLDTK
ncbi:MAG: UDP-N-acetylmuramate dehydrogenase [Candidatus Nealsonbacteria bacterium]|nr:UDP-N-acetylmuramate dehydrogenase [Candidatus Nealsonbacteria bacterium]